MHVHDFNATLLHLMGIDHEKLTYFFQGRDFRLTDVHGEVIHPHPGVIDVRLSAIPRSFPRSGFTFAYWHGAAHRDRALAVP